METEIAALNDLSGNRSAFTALRPALYVWIVLGVVLSTYAYKIRTEGIFACLADGYASNRYMAYCHAKGYGDYEHGAFWFGLDPSIPSSVANAEVLFLGSSRMQIALSTAATNQWFSSSRWRYFLLGFGYNGNALFEGELLHKFGSHAKVFVVSVDKFFERRESQPVRVVMRDSAARAHYEVKRVWQQLHKSACGTFPALCGKRYTIFRSRETGAYSLSGLGEFEGREVSFEQGVDQSEVDKEVAAGKPFLSELPVASDCVILTIVPSDDTKLGTAHAIAKALGMALVAPDVGGLRTFDGSHLDKTSAERWSDAFFKAAGPQIRRCLSKP